MGNRVLLGIPSGGSVKTKTMMSIIQVLFQTQAEIILVEREGALGPDNRNHLAQMALDEGNEPHRVTTPDGGSMITRGAVRRADRPPSCKRGTYGR